MPTFKDRNELAAWLRKRPREDLLVTAARAALRVAPLLGAGHDRWRRTIVLPLFRAMVAPWAAANYPAHGAVITSAADDAYAAAEAADAAAYAADAAAYADAAAAAYAAAEAAAYADADAAASAAYAAYAAAASAAYVAYVDAYAAYAADTDALEHGMTTSQLANRPLWLSVVRPDTIAQAWNDMKAALLAANEDWDVWTDWYDALLEGRLAESEAISLARVTLPEEFWTRGPKAVNAELKRLIEAEKRGQTPAADHRDFFLSYATKDEATARRIASVARAAGYSLFAQFDDMPPGSNFVREMQRGLGLCDRMIAVLSPNYEASDHCQAEWAHFYARDPGGAKRAIVPLLIHPTGLNALSKQVVYVNLVGLTDADAEARIRAALAPPGPIDHAATRRALAEAASPRPVLDAEGRVDIGRNPVFDAEVPSDDLYELPNRQLALIRTLRAGLARSNAPPAMVKSALDEYYEEIEKRGLTPSLGLLNDQIAIIEAEQKDDTDRIWCTGGIAQSLDRLCKNHELMRQHFPLDAERDRLYRDAPIDPNLIRDPAFLKASRATSAAMQEAAKDGAVTQDLAEAVERRDQQIQSIGATRASSDKDIFVAPEDRLAPPTLEKRILAQEAGFWDVFLQRSANVAQIGSSIEPVRQLLKILFGGW